MPFNRSAGTPTTQPTAKQTTATTGNVQPGVHRLSVKNGVVILPVVSIADR